MKREDSWKFVFYTNHKHWGHVSAAIKVIRRSGYKFFAWNGAVYRVPDDPKSYPLSQPTGIKESDSDLSRKFRKALRDIDT